MDATGTPNKYRGNAYEILRKKCPIPGDWIVEMDCFDDQIADYELTNKLVPWVIAIVANKKLKLTRIYHNPESDWAAWELTEVASQSVLYIKARMTTPKNGDYLLSPDSNHHYASLEPVNKTGVYGTEWVDAVVNTNHTSFVRTMHNAKSDFVMWQIAYLN